MKKLAALVALLFVLTARADAPPSWANGSWASNQWASGSWDATSTPTATVPNVVGSADFLTADAALEAVLLDGAELAAKCSAAPANEIIRQSVAAGTVVAEGTIISVTPSSGVACPPVGGAELIIILR